MEPFCIQCGAAAGSLCGQCREVYYCSKECQEKDWSIPGHASCCGFRKPSKNNQLPAHPSSSAPLSDSKKRSRNLMSIEQSEALSSPTSAFPQLDASPPPSACGDNNPLALLAPSSDISPENSASPCCPHPSVTAPSAHLPTPKNLFSSHALSPSHQLQQHRLNSPSSFSSPRLTSPRPSSTPPTRFDDIPPPVLSNICSYLTHWAANRIGLISKSWYFALHCREIVVVPRRRSEQIQHWHTDELLSKSLLRCCCIRVLNLNNCFWTLQISQANLQLILSTFGNSLEEIVLWNLRKITELNFTSPKLKSLDLWGCTELESIKLSEAPELKMLNVSKTLVTDETLSHILQQCPNMKIGVFQYCRMLKHPKFIHQQMTTLHLEDSRNFVDIDITCPLLRRASLVRTRITEGAVMRLLNNHPLLLDLNLRICKRINTLVFQHPTLMSLNLQSSRIQIVQIEAPYLQQVNVRDTMRYLRVCDIASARADFSLLTDPKPTDAEYESYRNSYFLRGAHREFQPFEAGRKMFLMPILDKVKREEARKQEEARAVAAKLAADSAPESMHQLQQPAQE